MGINDCLLTDFAIKKQITAYEKIMQALTNSDKRHYQSAFYEMNRIEFVLNFLNF